MNEWMASGDLLYSIEKTLHPIHVTSAGRLIMCGDDSGLTGLQQGVVWQDGPQEVFTLPG